MNNRQKQIGIDRLIRLKWLECTSNLILAGNDENAVKDELVQLLAPAFPSSSPAKRGSLSKTLTILLKTWLRVPRYIHPLRDTGLELLQSAKRSDHLAIHWGMIMAAYPFWGAVAGQTGRLLRLQESVAASQIQRRAREQYGERKTVSRAAQRVIRSFIDWGVLSETKEKGIYSQGHPYSIDDPRLISWLVEVSLHARSSGSAAVKELLGSTNLFPFRLMHVSAEQLVSMSPRLDLLRHGLDDDLVMIEKKVWQPEMEVQNNLTTAPALLKT
ncbi:MAG: hypothetical protein B6D68_00370 [spirochete symbiont of Stewartia floridana]|nr:MAG: hypothetical protein B6D68_00370 [spirochete symbiont of Stewartia floridana]